MARHFKPGQLQTGSLYNISASYAVTASFALNGGGTSINTGSFVTTASFNSFTASYTTGSFTGSFKGDGSQLTGITSASYSTTASYVTLAQTASYVQTAQTASYVLQAVSASFATSASYAPDTTFPFTGSARITGSLTVTGSTTSTQIGAGAAPSGSIRLDVRAQGTLSTDLAFRVRNSADTRDIINVRGNKTIELIADTPATNGGISITTSAYNEPIIDMYDSFGSKKLIIDTSNALITLGGSGNIKIGSLTTTNSYLGLVTPTTNNRFLKLVDAFNNEYLSLGGNAYDGSGGISLTLKTTTTNGTNFVTFSRSNNTNPVVISDLGYLGVGTGSAAARLDVKAQGALSTDLAFRVRNSADNDNLLEVGGSGIIKFKTGTERLEINTATADYKLSVYKYSTEMTRISTYLSYFCYGSSGQYLGIGTNAPTHLLDLSLGATQNQIITRFGNNFNDTSQSDVTLKFTTGYTGGSFGGNPLAYLTIGNNGGVGVNNNCKSYFKFLLNKGNTLAERASITSQSNLLLQAPTEDTNDIGVVYVPNGTAPTASIIDGFKQYSADITAGNAAPHFRTENGTIVWLGDESRLFNVTASNMMVGVTSSLALFTSQRTTVNIGTTTIYAFPTASYDGAFIDYTARSGSNARAGQIMGIWSGSAVNFTETTTTDFGSTSGLTFGMSISASSMIVSASAATAGWIVKTIIRSI